MSLLFMGHGSAVSSMSMSTGTRRHQEIQPTHCSKSGLQMGRLALIPNKGSREKMSSQSKGDGQEEGPGFTQLGP